MTVMDLADVNERLNLMVDVFYPKEDEKPKVPRMVKTRAQIEDEARDFDTVNRWEVSIVEGQIMIGMLERGMTKAAALNLAAWIVCLADDTNSFIDFLEAVQDSGPITSLPIKTMREALEALNQAKELLEAFTQSALARDGEGQPCSPSSPLARSFSIVGACMRATHNLQLGPGVLVEVLNAVASTLWQEEGEHLITVYNERLSTTKDSVQKIMTSCIASYDRKVKRYGMLA